MLPASVNAQSANIFVAVFLKLKYLSQALNLNYKKLKNVEKKVIFFKFVQILLWFLDANKKVFLHLNRKTERQVVYKCRWVVLLSF